VAGPGLPGAARPGGRPLRARPDHPGRRVRQRAHRLGPEAASLPAPHEDATAAFDAATCIGCVAACPNASASLFTAAKVTHLGLLPQGQPERADRVTAMVLQMDYEGFGGCTNTGVCVTLCPKGIPLAVISQRNSDLLRAHRP
jgi:succinate dehydrogenase / fumarate reductase iron-sulfur subunit